jgi:hypothetical protein
MMSLWAGFEDLVLEYMEARVAEMLDRGDVTSPKVIAHVRETAAWAAERAVARFQASLKKGSGFPEKVFVFNTNSQHAYGNAVDIDSTGRNFITPDFAAWARTHDRELHAAGEFDKTLILVLPIRVWTLVTFRCFRKPCLCRHHLPCDRSFYGPNRREQVLDPMIAFSSIDGLI